MRIEKRVAVVTGASRGIGAALAGELRRAGARLVLNARDERALRAVAMEGDLVVPGDISSDDVRRRLASEAFAHFGRVDLLINNAGVGLYRDSMEADSREIRALWELNFFAPLELARLIVPHMLGQERLGGAAEAGMVVNVSSIAGKVTLPWFSMYSASKHALCSWTEALRMEYRRKGIRALSVCPGSVTTEFQSNVLSGAPSAALSSRRERFAITPEQCAKAILRGIARNRRSVVVPASGWLLVASKRLMPGAVEQYLARVNDAR